MLMSMPDYPHSRRGFLANLAAAPARRRTAGLRPAVQHRLPALARFRPLSFTVRLSGSDTQSPPPGVGRRPLPASLQRGAHLLAQPGIAADRAVRSPERNARARAPGLLDDGLPPAHRAHAARRRLSFGACRPAACGRETGTDRLRRDPAPGHHAGRRRGSPGSGVPDTKPAGPFFLDCGFFETHREYPKPIGGRRSALYTAALADHRYSGHARRHGRVSCERAQSGSRRRARFSMPWRATAWRRTRW